MTPAHRAAGGLRRQGRNSGSSLGNGLQQQKEQTTPHPAGGQKDLNTRLNKCSSFEVSRLRMLDVTNLEVRLEDMFCTPGDQLTDSYSLMSGKVKY